MPGSEVDLHVNRERKVISKQIKNITEQTAFEYSCCP